MDAAVFHLRLGLKTKRERWCGEIKEEKDVKDRMEGGSYTTSESNARIWVSGFWVRVSKLKERINKFSFVGY